MSKEDHEQLLDVLSAVKGRFILSGYLSAVYAWVERRENWHRVDIDIDNKSSSAKAKEIKTECLWMNFQSENRV
jgi:hypothetical protein